MRLRRATAMAAAVVVVVVVVDDELWVEVEVALEAPSDCGRYEGMAAYWVAVGGSRREVRRRRLKMGHGRMRFGAGSALSGFRSSRGLCHLSLVSSSILSLASLFSFTCDRLHSEMHMHSSIWAFSRRCSRKLTRTEPLAFASTHARARSAIKQRGVSR